MATKKRGGGRKRWTVRQKEIVSDVFGGAPVTQKELDRIERLLKLMRGHKQLERQRKRSRGTRQWPVKP